MTLVFDCLDDSTVSETSLLEDNIGGSASKDTIGNDESVVDSEPIDLGNENEDTDKIDELDNPEPSAEEELSFPDDEKVGSYVCVG